MRALFDFLRKYNYFFLFLFLEILSIVLITRNGYYQSAKLVSTGNAISGGIHSVVRSVTEYFGLKHQNEALAEENARLRAQLESSYISYTNKEFVVNDTVYKQQYSYIEAGVIKNSWTNRNNYIMINKGENHGVMVDMAVVSPQGMVGVVVNTTANFSTIMPVLHSDSRNSVKIKRTDSNGTLEWDGSDYRYAHVVDIPTTHKLYKNDTVVTSGLANDFPEGEMVGYVVALSSKPGSGFYRVKIRLATDFNKLNHVYIVNNLFRDEQDTLMNRTLQLN